jgi:hypothetical protein
MLVQIIQWLSGTLMVMAAIILAYSSNPAWPVVGAAGILFWGASVRSYRSIIRASTPAKANEDQA